MNERIRELWRQAVLNNTKTPMNFQDAADEFAELLIKKCADIADKAEPYKANDLIKKHFGVEE